MNPLVRLILAVALGVAWYAVSRAYAAGSRVNKEDPAGLEQRHRVTGGLRALAFFGLVWFIASTAVIFIFALVIAIVAPPENRNFGEGFADIINSASGATGPLNPFSLWGAIGTMVATIAAVWISQRVARGKSILDLGLRPYRELPLDLLLGIFLGPLLFAIIFQLEQLLGYIVGNRGPTFNWSQLAQAFAIFICVAVSEELVVRGYFLQVLNEVWGGAVSVVVTSLFWGFAHLLNPRATMLGSLNIVVAGLIFAYAYSLTGKLWLPIALHFSWNFAEGAIFGYPVSGFPVSGPVFEPLVNGPQEMTGGLFGPEGGLLSLLAILIGGVILYGWDKIRRPPGLENTGPGPNGQL
jgi:membrane protease YdiL (CAAX protease family)